METGKIQKDNTDLNTEKLKIWGESSKSRLRTTKRKKYASKL